MKVFLGFLAAVMAVVLVLACGGADQKTSEPGRGHADPGDGVGYDVRAALSAALDCPAADIAWSVVEPGGGTVAGGLYTPPACGSPVIPGTFHVRGEGCGRWAEVPIAVAEEVRSVAVCGVAAGAACCAPSLSLPPSGTAQFYATVTYSCPGHVEHSPSPPPPACP